jgi:hypothetical protein
MRTKILISSGVAALLSASVGLAQTPPPEAVRVRHAALELSIDYPAQKLAGSMTYDLENWTTHPASQVSFLLNRLMDVSQVLDGARRERVINARSHRALSGDDSDEEVNFI